MRKIWLMVLALLVLPFGVNAQTVRVDNTVFSDDFSSYANLHTVEFIRHGKRVDVGVIAGQFIINDTDRYWNTIYGGSLSKTAQRYLWRVEATGITPIDDSGFDTKLLYSALFRGQPNAFSSVDLFADRTVAEITSGFGNLVAVNSYGATFDIYLGDLTTTFGLIEQRIPPRNPDNDALERSIYIGNLSYDLQPNFGVIATNRLLHSSRTSQYFFSPLEMSTHLGGVYYSYVTPGDNHVLRLQASYGVKTIDGDTSPSYDLQLRTRGWFTDRYGVESRFHYTDVTSDSVTYSNFYANVMFVFRIR